MVRGSACAALAVALALSFPFRAGSLAFDVGMFVVWIVPICLVALCRDLSSQRAFVLVTLAATLGYAGVLYWIYVVVHVHGHASSGVALLAVGALALYCGVHVGAVGAAAAYALRRGLWAVLVVPSAWVAAEHLRTFDLFSGFPWGFLGYALYEPEPARRLASVAGVYGLTFLVVAVGTAIGLGGRSRVGGLALLGILALATVAFPEEEPAVGAMRVGIVQANIPQGTKWDPANARAAFDAHLAVSREVAADGVDLVVWPEASVPVFLEIEPEYREAVSELARETSTALLLGGMAAERESGSREVRFFNSVFAVEPDGRFVDRYDKSLLVPFGEYVPLRSLLGFLSGIATGIASGDVTAGPGPRTLVSSGFSGSPVLAPLICYEVIYPELVREAVLAGAEVLINVTNDAWYGRTSAPRQFLSIAAMRSAEHGRPMVRAANTGISALVDRDGRIRATTPIFERRGLVGSLAPASGGFTLYTRFGQWVVWASWTILALAGGRQLVRNQRRRTGDGGSAPSTPGEGVGVAEVSLTSKRSVDGSRS